MFLLAHAQLPKSDCLVGSRRRNEENVHTKKITNNFWDRIDAGAAREEFGATIEIRRQLPKAINHLLSQFLNFFQPISSLCCCKAPPNNTWWGWACLNSKNELNWIQWCSMAEMMRRNMKLHEVEHYAINQKFKYRKFSLSSQRWSSATITSAISARLSSPSTLKIVRWGNILSRKYLITYTQRDYIHWIFSE